MVHPSRRSHPLLYPRPRRPQIAAVAIRGAEAAVAIRGAEAVEAEAMEVEAVAVGCRPCIR